MDEGSACAQLKTRFEAAGFKIVENRLFDEGGVRFEMDGFDAARRVGYEYVTSEAGDSWDVDADVIEALEARRKAGEVFVLIVDETAAPDAVSLDVAITTFLKGLPAQPDADEDDDSADDDADGDDADEDPPKSAKVQSVAAKTSKKTVKATAKPKAEPKPKTAAKPKAASKPKAKAASKPKAKRAK